MKKVFMMIMAIAFCAAVALAGPVDRELPETTPAQIKNSVRQMVDQGFNPQEVIDMTQQMLANNFREQQVLQAQAILMNARRQGLPTEPMMNKAYEGLAKQVQAEAVVKAMERVQSRYEFATKQARAVTSDEARISQMAAILAESMAAGMNDEDAGRIMRALRERTRNMAQAHSEELAMQTFMTTRTMARLGMQSKSVGDSVCQALQQGCSAQEMLNMRNTIMANARHSYSESFSKGHSFDAGQQGGRGGDSGGGMDGGNGGGGGGMGGGRK
jgi:ABC-type uncharacterized transport system YnjBCD ATPase subunit